MARNRSFQMARKRGVMENFGYLMTYEILDEIMPMPSEIRVKYREGLRLIVEQGEEPRTAFEQSGFIVAYE